MKEKLMKNLNNISVSIIAFSGIACITTGIILPKAFKTEVKKTKVTVTEKKVASIKSNEIILKAMINEVNQPLSVDVKDYVEDTLDQDVLSKLKLDTSMVNTKEAGNYTYTISYKKKTFNGVYTIKDKELPKIDTMTLKTLTLTVGSSIPTDLNSYIVETISDEVKPNVKLDLTAINTKVAGTYQYTVTYNGRFYTGKVVVFEPQQQSTKTEIPKTTDENKTVTTTN